jgi:hypothetical protein
MSRTTSWQLPRPYDGAAVVLGALGIGVFFFAPFYICLVLSLTAGGVLVRSRWIKHQPKTRWTSAATFLVVVGLVLQLGYALTVPVNTAGGG